MSLVLRDVWGIPLTRNIIHEGVIEASHIIAGACDIGHCFVIDSCLVIHVRTVKRFFLTLPVILLVSPEIVSRSNGVIIA